MIEDGQIKGMGSPIAMLGDTTILSKGLEREQAPPEFDQAAGVTLDVKKSEVLEAAGSKLIMDEEIEIGRVSWDACECP
jgi:hypothetical protein